MSTYHPLRDDDLSNLHQGIPIDPLSVVKTITSPATVLTKLRKASKAKAGKSRRVRHNRFEKLPVYTRQRTAFTSKY
jgi:hypothetical protein